MRAGRVFEVTQEVLHALIGRVTDIRIRLGLWLGLRRLLLWLGRGLLLLRWLRWSVRRRLRSLLGLWRRAQGLGGVTGAEQRWLRRSWRGRRQWVLGRHIRERLRGNAGGTGQWFRH
ncbi:hypothetical protein A5658_23855 [Mycobacterium sp. 1245111.1]|nr:hypothetical protein A5658_23855 [Mycobacterium sp. 1245111.1]